MTASAESFAVQPRIYATLHSQYSIGGGISSLFTAGIRMAFSGFGAKYNQIFLLLFVNEITREFLHKITWE